MKKSMILLFVVATFAGGAWAAVPQIIGYQGYVKNADGTPVNSAVSVTFSVYSSNPSRNNPVWREPRSVTPANGIYSLQLGAVTPLALPFDVPYWLGVQVGSDPEMTPLQAFTAVGYAFRSVVAETVSDRTIGTASIADDAVTDAKIAGPISGGKLGAHTHPGTDITAPLDASIITAGTVSDARLSGNVMLLDAPQTVTGAKTFTNSISTSAPIVSTNTGTAPLQVASTTMVSNLNAERVGDNRVVDLDVRYLTGQSRVYTGVISVKTIGCPPGFTQNSVSSLAGANGQLYVNVTSGGLFMGGASNTANSDQYLNASLSTVTSGSAQICSKTYKSSGGSPHASFFFVNPSQNSTACPTGYAYVPIAEISGSDGNSYLAANKSGFYLGPAASYAVSSQTTGGSGYLSRSLTTQTGGVCFSVKGVDEDPATDRGVYPVFLGLSALSACPAGWSAAPVSTYAGNNNYSYLQITDNASAFGGTYSWNNGGADYNTAYFTSTQVNFICWHLFPVSMHATYEILTPQQGSCPTGFLSFDASALKGWDGNGYIAATGGGLYAGGLYSWSTVDNDNGSIRNSFASEVTNKVCVKIDNVK